jgi:hypothetical protein
MNKKIVLLIAIMVIVLLAGVGFLSYTQSLKTVTFTIKNVTVGIYKATNTKANAKVTSLSKSGTIKLQQGNYVAIPNPGTHYDTTPIGFTVTGNDTSVTVDPSYSNDYLNTLLSTELSAINEAITTTYPIVLSDFTLTVGHLYKQGQWYATTLPQVSNGGEQGDVYRTVLEKEGGTWKVVATPAIVLSTNENKAVPIAILKDINDR